MLSLKFCKNFFIFILIKVILCRRITFELLKWFTIYLLFGYDWLMFKYDVRAVFCYWCGIILLFTVKNKKNRTNRKEEAIQYFFTQSTQKQLLISTVLKIYLGCSMSILICKKFPGIYIWFAKYIMKALWINFVTLNETCGLILWKKACIIILKRVPFLRILKWKKVIVGLIFRCRLNNL